jgi:hypothetical protein
MATLNNLVQNHEEIVGRPGSGSCSEATAAPFCRLPAVPDGMRKQGCSLMRTAGEHTLKLLALSPGRCRGFLLYGGRGARAALRNGDAGLALLVVQFQVAVSSVHPEDRAPFRSLAGED